MSLRMTLRKGAKGTLVSELQKRLNAILAISQLIPDGDFNESTRKIVVVFQKNANITADGVVGKGTWTALANAATHLANSLVSYNILAGIAARYIGVKEVGGNRAGSSKKMLEIFEADNLTINGKTDGYPWCAAFVSLCVQKLLKSSNLYGTITPPREPSVSRFLNTWAKQNNCLVFSPDSKNFTAMEGDIVVFVFSHIGIVESNNGVIVRTIEGNTNDAGSREGVTVARKQRSPRLIKSVIRLPMTSIEVDRKLKYAAQYC